MLHLRAVALKITGRFQGNRNKSKNKPMGPNKTDKIFFCTAKETIKKERQPMEWKKNRFKCCN